MTQARLLQHRHRRDMLLSTRGQPLPYQNALQRVYMSSMALGRVLIQAKKTRRPKSRFTETDFCYLPISLTVACTYDNTSVTYECY